MASGSASRANNPDGSKSFDFASDDILCSYEDYGNQDSPNGSHSDSVIPTTKDSQKSRMSRLPVFPTTNIYSQPEDPLTQEVSSNVERTMKKYTDNLIRILEGISSRLSQLEMYCYNLDKSIGEMRSDLIRDHAESEKKLKSLDKHMQEVHRSVQILRDKQELAETQKELAKLQLAQKESSPEEKNATLGKADDASEGHNHQLALALPHQVAPQPSKPVEQQQSLVLPSQTSSHTVNQPPPYYMVSTQLPNPQTLSAAPQGPCMLADAAYRAPPFVAPQLTQTQVVSAPSYPQFPQWSQQVVQPVQYPRNPSIQPQVQVRPPSAAYPPYVNSPPTDPPPPEPIPSSMPMQVPYPGIPHPGAGGGEPMPYGYGGAGRPVQPQQSKGGFGTQPVDGYRADVSPLSVSSGGAYNMMYDSERSRPLHPPQQPQYPPGDYPPVSIPPQNQPPPSSAGLMVRNQNFPQYFRNHPFNELIDKLVSMGYRGDHVAGVIQRLEESGQPVDFNAVLDRLNRSSSGGPQRGW